MDFRLKPEELERIACLANVEKGSLYSMLGYSLNLETGELRDLLAEDAKPGLEAQVLAILLAHYSSAEAAVPKAEKLIKYGDLPGGHAYEKAFNQRAVQPIADGFGENPAELIKTAKLLGGIALEVGDAAVDIPTLHGISLVYILWAKGEFPASVTLLYDESASHYLPTEDLAVLAELTTSRLLKAQAIIRNKK
jgi:hypothetical protein